ncbi:hypothetical protein BaRGS_00011947 [Batillaria attramentaria]|uniref:Carboxylic ester hydrolase n=1 Tax=Batillaria attramentaria TaxID=370345 RepID=A0ABD0LBU8_9CAEN
MELALLVFSVIIGLCQLSASAPVIPAPWGSVQGVDIEGQGGRRLSGYLGIPYALPPTGELRWMKPQPHPGPGEGKAFAADTLMPACPQELPGMGVYAGISEDCLTLNVYTPADSDPQTSSRPVMIFIHGGGFFMGDAPPYRPTKLVADGGVIVVTIQYRLGPLSFLSTGDDWLPGNLAFWDQNLAICWVKDNIRAFGGDPETMTLFGESAGSMSVGYQMISPHSKGLFQRVILQSNCPMPMSSFGVDEVKAFEGLAKTLDCVRDSREEALDCMRTHSAEEIISKTSAFTKATPEPQFQPRVDGEFLPREPLELVSDEKYVQEIGLADLDVLVGFNNMEGSVFLFTMLMSGTPLQALGTPQVFQGVLDHAVKTGNRGKVDDVVKLAVEFFYRMGDFGTDAPVPVDAVLNLYSDPLMLAPIVNWTRTLAAQEPRTGSRYMYLLDHAFDFNNYGPAPGSHHGDDLVLEWEFLVPEGGMNILTMMNKTHLTKEEEGLSDLFVDIVTTFAKTGNPSPAVKSVTGGDWPEFTSENEAYLALSQNPRVERNVYRDRSALWLQLVPQLAGASQDNQQAKSEAAKVKEEL